MPWWAELAITLAKLLYPIVKDIVDRPKSARSERVAELDDHVRTGFTGARDRI